VPIQLGLVRRQHLALDKDAPVYGVPYLASEESLQVTGTRFVVDGGMDLIGLTCGVTARFI
jgi:hypothetical protein